MNGKSWPAKRTRAESETADILANPKTSEVTMLGSGNQTRTQLEVVYCVRTIKDVRVFSPILVHAKQFASEMLGPGKIPNKIYPVESAVEAVYNSDIVCAATTSSYPVFEFKDLKQGTHVNGVG